MKIRLNAFNFYLLAAALLLGCRSPQEKLDAAEGRRQKKELTALQLHLEAGGGNLSRTETVPILRASPALVKVQTESFLDERDIVAAKVSDHMDGFVLQLQFNEHGTLVLDSISTANKGKRVGIYSNFGETRWLAAPVLSKRITDGVLTFTPDATREETVRIARGLNNAAAIIKRKEQFFGW